MLPRLEAERDLRAYGVALAAGQVGMDEQGREEFLESLKARAMGIVDDRPRVQNVKSVAGLKGLGIGVEIVEGVKAAPIVIGKEPSAARQ